MNFRAMKGKRMNSLDRVLNYDVLYCVSSVRAYNECMVCSNTSCGRVFVVA